MPEIFCLEMIIGAFLLFLAFSVGLYYHDKKKSKQEGRAVNPVFKTIYIIASALCITLLIGAVAFCILLTLAMYNM